MTVDTVGRFERALEGLEVGFERVPAADASERIATIVEEPAVGAPLPFEGVTLPESVTTEPTSADLEAARTGVTPAGFAIAEYGTVAVESTADGAEAISLYSDRHVAVVAESDVVPDLSAGFDRLADGFAAGQDSVVFATGRSATADMGDLVHGVHGPGDVDVIVVEDR
ncbi:LUD domain-containing protein [Natrinema hispanicum]|uniref:L-lactate dehydrogenase complex protein LldG n=1 Tax=Natrinema hispanicum TaxID=392421 RepID=A0A1G6JFI3_9EURY|nr:LUD domain-containing protein [Natrinema hispanicum]SDC17504.1 L-lactate dehydrogenase complex protein LldG [Natrinema hispanicum]SES66275.1 L-lactate dehydrogenase complex protein LldG [Natrinema hispanicum]